MYSNSVGKLGFWSALATSILSIFFSIIAIIAVTGLITKHQSNIFAFGSSILLAVTFVIMMVCIHYIATEDRKVWSHIGLVFAVLYAALVTIVYSTLIFAVEPYIMRGEADKIAFFVFDQGTFTQIVDGLGYSFMSLATLFAAPVFAGKKGLFWTFIANGLMGLLVFISYITYNMFLGIPWMFTLPASAILATIYFWHIKNK